MQWLQNLDIVESLPSCSHTTLGVLRQQLVEQPERLVHNSDWEWQECCDARLCTLCQEDESKKFGGRWHALVYVDHRAAQECPGSACLDPDDGGQDSGNYY